MAKEEAIKKLIFNSGSFYIPLPKTMKDFLEIKDHVYLTIDKDSIIIKKIDLPTNPTKGNQNEK
jgi:hypothetical protein